MKTQVEKIFDDLEKYLNFCRLELREYDPSHLYDKNNDNYKAFLNSFKSNRSYNRDDRKKNYKKNEQNFHS